MFIIGMLSMLVVSQMHFSYGAYVKAPALPTGHTVNDPNLAVVKATGGLKAPSSAVS
jgi:aldose sugar dehydrogenase